MKGLEKDLGLFVAGGKGKTSRRTPLEIEGWGDLISLDPAPLIYASRMSAKVDTAAVQDGYQLLSPYLPVYHQWLVGGYSAGYE